MRGHGHRRHIPLRYDHVDSDAREPEFLFMAPRNEPVTQGLVHSHARIPRNDAVRRQYQSIRTDAPEVPLVPTRTVACSRSASHFTVTRIPYLSVMD